MFALFRILKQVCVYKSCALLFKKDWIYCGTFIKIPDIFKTRSMLQRCHWSSHIEGYVSKKKECFYYNKKQCLSQNLPSIEIQQ